MEGEREDKAGLEGNRRDAPFLIHHVSVRNNMWVSGYRRFQRKLISRYQNVTFKTTGWSGEQTRKYKPPSKRAK